MFCLEVDMGEGSLRDLGNNARNMSEVIGKIFEDDNVSRGKGGG